MKITNPLDEAVSFTFKGLDFVVEANSSTEVDQKVGEKWVQTHEFLLSSSAPVVEAPVEEVAEEASEEVPEEVAEEEVKEEAEEEVVGKPKKKSKKSKK